MSVFLSLVEFFRKRQQERARSEKLQREQAERFQSLQPSVDEIRSEGQSGLHSVPCVDCRRPVDPQGRPGEFLCPPCAVRRRKQPSSYQSSSTHSDDLSTAIVVAIDSGTDSVSPGFEFSGGGGDFGGGGSSGDW